MNSAKALQDLLQDSINKNHLHQIFSESPRTTPFLKSLCEDAPDVVRTLPCSNTSMLSLAMGASIGGGKILISLSTDSDIETLFALLKEESYGAEFPLSLIILLPTFTPKTSSFPYVYCRTGPQLIAHVTSALSSSSLQIVAYAPSALLDGFEQEEHRGNIIHQQGSHISMFTCGDHIQQAKDFAQAHSDVELIEIVSLSPLHKSDIIQSIHKTGRVLLIDPPEPLLPAIIDLAFWHLEAQPVITKDLSFTNLEQLRHQLLEP